MINQKGIASLVLLTMILFGVFILWEINQYTEKYNDLGGAADSGGASPAPESAGPPICLTGEAGNCNDSNDQFLLN